MVQFLGVIILFDNDRLSQIAKLEEQLQRYKGAVRFAAIGNVPATKREQKKVQEIEAEIKALQNLQMPGKTEHFEWQLNFSEVYQSKGGFDVIIANPPYGANLSEEHKNYLKSRHGNIVERIRNTFLYFLGEAYNQAKDNGSICFILPNELLFQIYMTKARRFFLENAQFLFAVNLGEDVFEAIVPTGVIAIAKTKQETYSIPVADLREAALEDLPRLLVTENFPQTTNEKILAAPNSMFSFDGLKSELINRLTADFEPFENFCEDVANGISTSCDEVYIVTEEFALANKFEKEYLKECIRGGQFNRFYCPEETREYVLYVTKTFDPKKGRNIYQYLSKNKDLLIRKSAEKRQGKRVWHILFRSRYEELFKSPKILFRQTGDSIISAVDREVGYYCIDSVNVGQIKPNFQDKLEFFSAILNSQLMVFFYREISQEEGRVLAQVKPQRIKALPIALPTNQQQQSIENLANHIISAKQSNPQADTRAWEAEIDSLVYALYGLTPAEIALVEGRDS